MSELTLVWLHWVLPCYRRQLRHEKVASWIRRLHVCFLEIFFNFFYIYFLLKKLINEKYFSIKEKFCLVSRKIFFFAVFVFRKVVSGKPLSKFSYICLSLEKLVNGKHFPVKEKFDLVSRKVFSWKIWAENTFRKLWKI